MLWRCAPLTLLTVVADGSVLPGTPSGVCTCGNPLSFKRFHPPGHVPGRFHVADAKGLRVHSVTVPTVRPLTLHIAHATCADSMSAFAVGPAPHHAPSECALGRPSFRFAFHDPGAYQIHFFHECAAHAPGAGQRGRLVQGYSAVVAVSVLGDDGGAAEGPGPTPRSVPTPRWLHASLAQAAWPTDHRFGSYQALLVAPEGTPSFGAYRWVPDSTWMNVSHIVGLPAAHDVTRLTFVGESRERTAAHNLAMLLLHHSRTSRAHEEAVRRSFAKTHDTVSFLFPFLWLAHLLAPPSQAAVHNRTLEIHFIHHKWLSQHDAVTAARDHPDFCRPSPGGLRQVILASGSHAVDYQPFSIFNKTVTHNLRRLHQACASDRVHLIATESPAVHPMCFSHDKMDGPAMNNGFMQRVNAATRRASQELRIPFFERAFEATRHRPDASDGMHYWRRDTWECVHRVRTDQRYRKKTARKQYELEMAKCRQLQFYRGNFVSMTVVVRLAFLLQQYLARLSA